MKNNIENYIEERCREVLKKVGVEEGQIILDFGCGGGNYTIPAAKIIGNAGKIYAVDEDGYKLKDLQEKAKSANLHNIEIIRTSGELNFGFEDGAFDVVLLYDIFWYFSLQSPELSELLKGVYRVLKPDGLISVYPEHIETEKLKQKMEKSGFYLVNRFRGKIIHEGRPEQGQILNFRKEQKMIKVEKKNQQEFTVKMEGKEYNVNLDDEHWQDLTEGKITKEELIKKSFKFLLEREPKESILTRFNLRVINQYFPEFEEEIRKQ